MADPSATAAKAAVRGLDIAETQRNILKWHDAKIESRIAWGIVKGCAIVAAALLTGVILHEVWWRRREPR